MPVSEDGGGAFALHSPTHAHHVDVTSAVRSLRRSISRSPSRFLSRATSRTSDGSTPTSPQSPCRRLRLTPRGQQQDHLSRSAHVQSAPPAAGFKHGSNTTQSPLTPLRQSSKLSLRSVKSARTSSPSRQMTRARASPKSPLRRALNTTSDIGNASAQQSHAALLSATQGSAGQENNTPQSPSPIQQRADDKPSRHSLHLDVSGASQNAFLKALDAKNDPSTSNAGGLKRNDAMMNLDQPYQGSPVPKRRSMHGVEDRSIFGSNQTLSNNLNFKIHEDTHKAGSHLESPPSSTPGNMKRSSSLRKSALQMRATEKGSWGKRTAENHLGQMNNENGAEPPTPARARAPVAGNQFDPPTPDSPFGSPAPTTNQPLHFAESKNTQAPHPLSQIQTMSTSSSGNSSTEGASSYAAARSSRPSAPHPFARSLPLNAERPTASMADEATPNKTSAHFRGAVGSTGLISKMNRHPEQQKLAPPDTPCKKQTDFFATYPSSQWPSALRKNKNNNRNSFAGISSLPFPTRARRGLELLDNSGNGPSIFDGQQTPSRSPRFHGFLRRDDADGDTTLFDDGPSTAPGFSNAPPTPTKGMTPSLSNLSDLSDQSGEQPFDSPSANRKNSGLHAVLSASKGRSPTPRASICKSIIPDNPYTAAPFSNTSQVASASPLGRRRTPQTPQELSLPENTSQLSISKLESGHPPATPTTDRDFRSSTGIFSTPVHEDTWGFGFNPPVEPSLQGKFDEVKKIGNGEFSVVYRVSEKAHLLDSSIAQKSIHREAARTPEKKKLFVIKKSKRPYLGPKDRERKIREAQILRTLKDTEHVVQYVADWEDQFHLYIQTELCENGSLKEFLDEEGSVGRLDEFCMFKILLDLTLGLKEIHDAGFMHLDMKPANIFVTFEGALKIGDFGLAREVSDTSALDMEGDREYMAPEMLHGGFGCPSDVFSLGLIVLEAIINVTIPGNGSEWQKLRSGDFSALPSLAWSASTKTSDHRSGLYIDELHSGQSYEADDFFGSHKRSELLQPPAFMEHPEHPDSLLSIVTWMMASEACDRPTVDHLLGLPSLQWIAGRRKAPATIFEGRWGPFDPEPAAVDVVDTEMTGM